MLVKKMEPQKYGATIALFCQKNQGVDQQNYGSYQPVQVANND